MRQLTLTVRVTYDPDRMSTMDRRSPLHAIEDRVYDAIRVAVWVRDVQITSAYDDVKADENVKD